MAYITQFYSWATGNTITEARLNGNITNITDALSGGTKDVNVLTLEIGSTTVIDNSQNFISTSKYNLNADGTAIDTAGAITYGAAQDAAIYWDGSANVIQQTTALTNSVTYNKFSHITSGTPANGIGVGIQFEVETSASNNEIGVVLDAVTTDVTGASEDFDFVIKCMAGGAAASEIGRFQSDGKLDLASGAEYQIAGTDVLSATTLGSGVVNSSLTSLGTLTSLTVDNVVINGNDISSSSGNLTITPPAGSAVVIDGGASFDGTVVTGLTSVTSTAFVGDLTGNADTATTATTATSATTAGTVTTAAQPTITSVGTLTSLTTSGVYSQDDTTDSTSGTTGSIHTDGGLGVVKDIVGDADIYTRASSDYSGSSTIVGFSSISTQLIYTKRVGNMVIIHYDIAGTSNSTSFSFTVPDTNIAQNVYETIGYTQDNGTVQSTPGRSRIDPSGTTVILSKNTAGAAWTASGTKRAIGTLIYEAT